MANYNDIFEEWPFWQAFRFTLTAPGAAGSNQFKLPLPFDGDADFVWRARLLDMSVAGAGWTGISGQTMRFIKRQFYLPTSEALSNIPIYDGNAQRSFSIPSSGLQNSGNALYPVPIIPEIRITRGSVLSVDLLQNRQNPATALSVELCFQGVKLYPKGTHYQVDRSKRYRSEPWVYSSFLPGPGAANQLFSNNLVRLDSDSTFLLFGLVTDMNGFTANAGGFGWSIRFFGPNGERTSQSNSTPQPGFISVNNMVGIGRRPGLVCPPIAYPPGGQITYDYQEAGVPFTVPSGRLPQQVINFVGAKLYEVK